MRSQYFYLLAIAVFFSLPTYLSAQSTCPNSDFSMGNFTNWQGRTGTCCPLNLPNVGIVAGRHTIMTGAGTDPNTGGGLPVVPPGYTASARIGNPGTGAQGDGIQYTFTVAPDSSNALFLYSYAVVLEDPGHTPAQQPRFELAVRDQFGSIIPCTEYVVTAGAGIPGFQDFGSIRWKPWEQVGVDLSTMVGQTVTIEIRTGDCSLSGHFGYAYVAAECRPMKLNVSYCENDYSASVTAPSGFTNYTWSTGDVGQTVVINNPTPNQTVICTLTSASGCAAYLNAVINQTVVTPDFADSSDCFSTVTFTDLSTVTNGNAVAWYWNFGDGNNSVAQSPIHTYATGGDYNVTLIVESNQGCMDTISKTVHVRQSPIAAFNAPAVCGFDIAFTNTSTPNTTLNDIHWDFGNGNSSNTSSPTHSYADPEISGLGYTYTVELWVQNQDFCADSISQTITLQDIPEADFTFIADCDQSVQFTNNSIIHDGNALNHSWDFGDGNSSSAHQPNPTYAAGGDYQVELIVSTNFGCADTLSQLVHVRQSPVADFSAPAVCGFDIGFVNNSVANTSFLSFDWDFGDGNNATTQTANHIYTDPEVSGLGYSYTVQLTVENQDNCFDSTTQTITLLDIPVADFSFVAECDQSVAYTNNTTIEDGTALQYNWDFGDGNSSVSSDPSPTYAAGGNYQVELIASTAFGCADTIQYQVYVRQSPLASFTAPSVCGFERQFTNTSTANNTFNSYSWDFGNGAADNISDPVYTYQNPATSGLGFDYTVTLIVENQDNCFDTTTQNITLWDIPQADFQLPVQSCVNEELSFTDISTVQNTTLDTWAWSFGDGATSALQNPTHFYSASGNYNIELIVTDINGCADTVSHSIPTFINPIADFPIPNACGIQVDYQDASLTNGGAALVGWNWNFGDGNTAPVQNPQHSYINTGNFNVELIVTNNDGCRDTIVQAVVVHELPVASFTFNDVCRYLSVPYTNTSFTAIEPIVSSEWTMHDATNYYTTNASHTYNIDGTYDVTLVVTTAFGCKDTLTQSVQIFPLPRPDFIASAVCDENAVPFQNTSHIALGTIAGYTWNVVGQGGLQSNAVNPNILMPGAGTYNVQLIAVSDQNCEDSIMHSVTVHPKPIASFFVVDKEGCGPHTTQITNTSFVAGGVLDYYDWDLGPGFSSDMNPVYTFPTGLHDITLVVTSDKGCKDTATVFSAVDAYPSPTADFESNPSKEDFASPFFQFTNLSDGYTTSNWSFGDGNTSTEHHPGHLYVPDSAGFYDVILVVQNEFGCADTTSDRVRIVGDHLIYIPNTATANNDGINDSFVIYGTNIKTAELLIFDRWGEKVGHVKGWQNDRLSWNCTNTAGNILKQDTYSYKLVYTAGSGKIYNLTGHVNIIY